MTQRKPFKRPPRRHQPPGLQVLFEDYDIVVVDKVSGLLTVANDSQDEGTAFMLLNDYVKKGNYKSKNRVYIVHRLDRDTSGLVVFAKSEQLQTALQSNWKNVRKKYYAVVVGRPPQDAGIITSYLAENSIHRMYSVNDPSAGKYAKTGYRVVKSNARYSLLEVDLFTGRKNQIRVHLADLKCPVAGDKKYGKKDRSIKRLCLHAASLQLKHPVSGEDLTLKAVMPDYFEQLLNRAQ
ncbi:MAG: hypothetical protein DHS20C11_04920 [Lysobacteraceae bacterium]|nr:MAG: hypothetical protein DHS20C11_04920 [Xanthomonadaceae bacterium]